MNKTTNKIRQDFLNFFKKKGHIILPSSSLIPDNDSTLLFTNAGMNQFKDIFLGYKKRVYPRVATVQRCLRTGGKHNDIDNVGYTEQHHTFFEMMGNFSFNDYFKKEAIMYAWELLTSPIWFNIPANKLWVSVYKEDDETYDIWKTIIKIPEERIIKIGDKNNIKYNSDNFWQMGNTGPCGPCTEIFYDYENYCVNNSLNILQEKKQCLIEIWNIVFIEFNRISIEKIIPLSMKSIDTGMGLERIASILQNVFSNYKIDIFQKLIKSISYFSRIKDLNHVSLKIIADHIRCCAFMIADNVIPSNEHRGYVLRRIIRRALRHGHQIGIKEAFFYKLVTSTIHIMASSGQILQNNKEKIEKILKIEEMQFTKTLDRGIKLLNKEIQYTKNNILDGATAFYLYDTFGFPIDLTADICREKNINIDYIRYNEAKEKQKKKSNTKKKFYKNYNDTIILDHTDTCHFKGYQTHSMQARVKNIFVDNKKVLSIIPGEKGIIFLDQTSFYGESGGQVGDRGQLCNAVSFFKVEETKKYGHTIGHIGILISGQITVNDYINGTIDQLYRNSIQLNHTATHLLHAALRKNLGNDVFQKGSCVDHIHLRFDFSYSKEIIFSMIQKIENTVNMQIRNNILIEIKQLSLEEAKKNHAIALFDYQDNAFVRVVFIKDFSIELCGGTHTRRTGDIGYFKIISHSSIASGIKRIEAITGQEAVNYLHIQDNDIHEISLILNSKNSSIKERVNKLITQVKFLEKKVMCLQHKENIENIKKLKIKIEIIHGIQLLTHTFDKYDRASLHNMLNQLKQELTNCIIILISITNNHFTVISSVTKDLIHQIEAKNIIQEFLNITNGNGGGKKEIAEGGGVNIKMLPLALKHIKLWINQYLLKINNNNKN